MQFPATTFTAIICDAVIQEKYTLLLSGQINWLRGLGCNKAKPFYMWGTTNLVQFVLCGSLCELKWWIFNLLNLSGLWAWIDRVPYFSHFKKSKQKCEWIVHFQAKGKVNVQVIWTPLYKKGINKIKISQ